MDNRIAMSPQDIADAYSVLAGQVKDYSNALTDRIGSAQSSVGRMADAVKGTSQTTNVGNYSYNRAVRPQLDSLTTSLVAKGLSDALNRQLYDALEQAKSNYNKAGSGSGGGNSDSQVPGDNNFAGVEKESLGSIDPGSYANKGWADLGIGTVNINGLNYPKAVQTPEGTHYYGYTTADEGGSVDDYWLGLMNQLGIKGN